MFIFIFIIIKRELYYINDYDKNLNNQFLVLFNFVGLYFDIWKKIKSTATIKTSIFNNNIQWNKKKHLKEKKKASEGKK
jgi:hypothetical protein